MVPNNLANSQAFHKGFTKQIQPLINAYTRIGANPWEMPFF
jgi:hypothetical protein